MRRDDVNTQRGATWNDSPHYGKRGPNGRRLCLECGEELSEKRKRFTFCGDECRNRHEIKCHPTAARWHVKARDHGICARCGLDCAALALIALALLGYALIWWLGHWRRG